MKIILKETIDALGFVGDEVEVAKGYARNFLLPFGKALISTPQNRKVFEINRAKFEMKVAKDKKAADVLAEKIEGIILEFKAKVADNDKLYGSVGNKDITDKLMQQVGVEVERSSVLLAKPIKTLGEFKVSVRLYKDVEPNMIVKVIASEE